MRSFCITASPSNTVTTGGIDQLEGFVQKVPYTGADVLAQRRKDAKRCRVSTGFLCAFAPLREEYFSFIKRKDDA